MKSFDIAVIGAGIVGSCAALSLARAGYRVALVEAHEPKPWSEALPDLRVVALANDNRKLLENCGVWQKIAARRVQPYTDMRVWIASSLLGVVAQRLIRRVCMKCRIVHIPTEFELNEMGMKTPPTGATFYKAVGCPSCSQSGYSGRTVIHELMMIDDHIKSLIVKSVDAGQIKKAAIERGMITLREDGIAKVLQGLTTIDELFRATHAEDVVG